MYNFPPDPYDSEQAYYSYDPETDYTNVCFIEENPTPMLVMYDCAAGPWSFKFPEITRSEDTSLKNKKVLVLVPGFTSTREQVAEALRSTAEKVSDSYDAVVAFVYPAGASPFYITARKIAQKTAETHLRTLIKNLSTTAFSVDVIAHSMGAFVTLEALNTSELKMKPNRIFLLGGADSQSKLESDRNYSAALKNAHAFINISSCQDQTLPLHTLVTGEETLGRPSSTEVGKLPTNVTFIDATHVVSNHTDYLDNQAVTDLIKFIAHNNISFPYRTYIYDGKFLSRTKPQVCVITPLQITGHVVHNMSRVFLNPFKNMIESLLSPKWA